VSATRCFKRADGSTVHARSVQSSRAQSVQMVASFRTLPQQGFSLRLFPSRSVSGPVAEGVSSRVGAYIGACSRGGTYRTVSVAGHPLTHPGGALVRLVWLFVWMHTLLAFQCSSGQVLGGRHHCHRPSMTQRRERRRLRRPHPRRRRGWRQRCRRPCTLPPPPPPTLRLRRAVAVRPTHP